MHRGTTAEINTIYETAAKNLRRAVLQTIAYTFYSESEEDCTQN
jgi:hypothetical protein